MHGSVNQNRGLGTFTTTAPNVDSSQCTSLDGASRSKDFRLASEATLQIPKERKVVGIRMVSGEPCLARYCDLLASDG